MTLAMRLSLIVIGLLLLSLSAFAVPVEDRGAAAHAAGSNVPTLSFTRDQASRGQDIYRQACASCHGQSLEGASGVPPLAGNMTPATYHEGSIQQLYTQLKRMPANAPGSLNEQQYVDVLSFLLERNGHPAGASELRLDDPRLTQVQVGIPHLHGATRTVHDITAQIGQGPSQVELDSAGPTTTDWISTNHAYDGQRFVDISQINPGNVATLHPVCMYQVGDTQPFPTYPIIYKGAMFITSRDSTISLDAATCELNWRYDRESRVDPGFHIHMNRGAAIKDGILYYATHDGYLVALETGTGREVWVQDLVNDPYTHGGFTMAPIVYGNLVIVGPCCESGLKGWLGAFRTDTGEPVWRFNTIPADGEAGAETWPDHASREHGNGGLFGNITLDHQGNLYVPVGSATPVLEGGAREGDNLYTDSMVVLDVNSGELKWFYQVTPHDIHDWDVTQASPLFSAKVGGRTRPLVVVTGKGGILHVVDRETHEVLYGVPVTTLSNRDKPYAPVSTTVPASELVCPSLVGGVQWSGAAYDPRVNRLFVPSVDLCVDPGQMRGWITALDASTSKILWRYRSERPMLAGITATSAGLLFSGDLFGNLLSLDARTGKVLYSFGTSGHITGGVPTYLVNGKQYVAVASGNQNPLWGYEPASSTIVVFALPSPPT